MRELPKRKRAAVWWGERSGAWVCLPAFAACPLLAGSTGGSCCSRGSLRSMLMDIWGGGFHTGTSRALLSPWQMHRVLLGSLCCSPCCWQHQPMALPLATLPDGCLALLEPPQLRQPLQPFIHSCQAESCLWEPLGALGV